MRHTEFTHHTERAQQQGETHRGTSTDMQQFLYEVTDETAYPLYELSLKILRRWSDPFEGASIVAQGSSGDARKFESTTVLLKGDGGPLV